MRQEIVYLDTETTGFVPGQICQLSYIIESDTGVRAKNFYFTVDKIEPKVIELLGKNERDYQILSGGKTFWDHAAEIYEDLHNKIWVAHNKKFDENFLNIEFWRAGYQIKPANSLCTMEYFKPIVKIPYANNPNKFKNPKLDEVIRSLSLNEGEILKLAKQLFNTDEDAMYHDSRFDATAMWVSVIINRIKDLTDDNSLQWKNRFVNK